MAKKKTLNNAFDAVMKKVEEEQAKQLAEEEAEQKKIGKEWASKGVNPEFARSFPTAASGLAAVKETLASIAPKASSQVGPEASIPEQPAPVKLPLGYAPRVNIADPRIEIMPTPVAPVVTKSVPGKMAAATAEAFLKRLPGMGHTDVTDTGTPGLNMAANIIGGTGSEIAQLVAAQKLATLMAAGLLSEQARKAIPPLATATGVGATARTIKWGAHKVADPESVTGKDLARDIAFGAGAGTAGELTSTALRHAYPGIHPLIEAPITGAAAGTGGAIAGYPFSDKKGMDYLKDMGSTILAQAILQTAWTAGTPSTWQPKQNFGKSMATARKHYDDIFEAFESGNQKAANVAYREFNKSMDNALHYAHQAGATPDPSVWRAKAEEIIRKGFDVRGWTPYAETPAHETAQAPTGIPSSESELPASAESVIPGGSPATPVIESPAPAVQPVVPEPIAQPAVADVVQAPKIEAPIQTEPIREPASIPESPEKVPDVSPEAVDKINKFRETYGTKFGKTIDDWMRRKEDVLEVLRPWLHELTADELKGEIYVQTTLHKEVILAALTEGLPVPQEVIDDYPELKRYAEKIIPTGAIKTTVPETPAPAEVVAKEPWQMTVNEYAKDKNERKLNMGTVNVDPGIPFEEQAWIALANLRKDEIFKVGSHTYTVTSITEKTLSLKDENGKTMRITRMDVPDERGNFFSRHASQFMLDARDALAIDSMREKKYNSDFFKHQSTPYKPHPLREALMRDPAWQHRQIIAQAFMEGKPIPDNVIAEYGDMIAMQAIAYDKPIPKILWKTHPDIIRMFKDHPEMARDNAAYRPEASVSESSKPMQSVDVESESVSSQVQPKEPWQMTLDEFSKAVENGEMDFPSRNPNQLNGAEQAARLARSKATGDNVDVEQKAFDAAMRRAHGYEMWKAHEDGKITTLAYVEYMREMEQLESQAGPSPDEASSETVIVESDETPKTETESEAQPVQQPKQEPTETIATRLEGKRWGKVATLTDTKTGETLNVVLQADPSDAGKYSAVIHNGVKSRTFQMKYKGGMSLVDAMNHLQEYLDEGDPNRFKVSLLSKEDAAEAAAQPTTTETTEQPETPESETSTSRYGVTVTENEGKDGVEIRFREKPDKDIIAQLHDLRFRWSPRQKLWYAKRTPERLKFAYGLAGREVPSAQALDTGTAQTVKPETPVSQSVTTQSQKEPVAESSSATSQPSGKMEQEVTTDVQDTGRPVQVSSDELGIQGTSPLEEIPSEDVQGAEEEGHPVQDGIQRPGKDKGRNVPSDRGRGERPQLGQGVGTGEGGVDIPSDGGGHATTRGGEEAGASKPASHGGRRDRDRVIVATNYRITDADNLGAGGEKTKAKGNIEAIRVLKKIEAEGRSATPEEQAILVKYVGWGGLANVFKENYYGNSTDPKWTAEHDELKALLTKEEWASASHTVLNAHYTSKTVIDAMWNAVRRFGFNGGRVLEPAAGIGHFVGLMPDDLRGSRVTCIELDDVTGRIAKLLYPHSDVRVQGFEDARLVDNFYDLIITNVPFGTNKLAEERYNKYDFRIHDHFIAKSIDKVRPGGLVFVITSSGTMNSEQSGRLRAYVNDRADFIGAVRLPNNAFKANAGTQVTTDIILLRKRLEGEKPSGQAWLKTVPTEIIGKYDEVLNNNEYYIAHPEMMLGTPVEDTLHTGRLALAPDGRDLGEALAEAFQRLPENIMSETKHPIEDVKPLELVSLPGTAKTGAYIIHNGKVSVNMGQGLVIPIKASKQRLDKIKGMIALRDATMGLIHLQREGASDAAIRNAQKALNNLYDNFVKTYGYLHDNANKKVFIEDPDFHLVMSLETKYRPAKKGKPASAGKADIFTKRTMPQEVKITHVDTTEEALSVTLNQVGRLDIHNMAQLTGKTENEITSALRGTLIFNDPTKGWVTRDEYLSGNVRKKLQEAEIAAKTDPQYKENVEALKQVQPPKLEFEQLTIKMGSTSMPPDVIKAFMTHLLGEPRGWNSEYTVNYIPQTGAWIVRAPKGIRNNVASRRTYGTNRRSAVDLIADHILYGKAPVVVDTLEDGTKVTNTTETIAAQEKCRLIEEEFQKWLLDNKDIRDRLVESHNDKFASIRLEQHDGSHLTFPGQNKMVLRNGELDPHQKNVVWRIIKRGNTLIAHPVGSGKTYSMCTAIMELKRLNICKKILFVVPGNRVESTAEEFLRLYPTANILVADSDKMNKQNRPKTASQIATGDYDAIIMAQSSLGKISMSGDFIKSFFEDQIQELREALQLELEGGYRPDKNFVKALESAIEALQTRMKRALQGLKQDKSAMCFEDLGIDGLFLDESHEFKNLMYTTRLDRVKGLGSRKVVQKTFDLQMKLNYLRKLNGGRGIVFATGTPISNAAVELYTLQKYLQPDTLKELGIYNFDAWQRTFGNIKPTVELDATGSQFKTYQRLAEYVNAGDLLTMFRSFADVVPKEDLNLPLPKVRDGGRKPTKCERPQGLKEYIDELVKRMDAVRSRAVSKHDDNPLKIMGDARKAALDLSLVVPGAPDDPRSKLNIAAQKIAEIYKETKKDKLTQLVFTDLGIPKEGELTAKSVEELDPDDLSVFSKLKQKLIQLGVREDEIAFIHEAKTDAQKQELFDDVNNGDIRVLIGTTAKMGQGTNAQERLIALHHLDVPWRPSDIEQREGRILRQGNTNEEVQIYAYVTEGSFDAAMWKTCEIKAGFIEQAMTGDLSMRVMPDTSDTILGYAMMAAEASGDPDVMRHFEVISKVNELTRLKDHHLKTKIETREAIDYSKDRIKVLSDDIANMKKDLERHEDTKGDHFRIVIGQKTYTARTDAGSALEKALNAVRGYDPVVIGEFAGFTITGQRGREKQNVMLAIHGAHCYECPTPSLGSLEATVRGIDNKLNQVSEVVTKLKEKIASLEAEYQKPFAHDKELTELIRERDILAAKLEPEKMSQQDIIPDADDEEDIDALGYPMPKKGVLKSGAKSTEFKAKAESQSSAESRTAEPKQKSASEPIGKQDIIRYISEKLLVPIRTGRLFNKRALGEYKVRDAVARIKKANDLETAYHEAGHHVHYVMELTPDKLKMFKEELLPLGEALYPNETVGLQLKEGFAEFFREYIMDADKAREIAPLFSDYFEDAMDKDLKAVVKTIQDMHSKYNLQSAADRVGAMIEHKDQKVKGFLTEKEEGYADWADEIHGLYKAMKELYPEEIKSEKDVPVPLNTYILRRLANSSSRSASGLLTHGMVSPELEVIGPSYKAILKPIANRLSEFERYITALHAIEIEDRGMDSGFDRADCEATIELYDCPEFRKAAEQREKFMDNLIDWLVDSGALSEKTATAMRKTYQHHVSFYRVFEEGDSRGPRRGGRRMVDLPSPIKRQHGSTRPIYSPIQNDILNVFYFMDIAKRSYAAKALADLSDKAEGKGWLIEKVPAPSEVSKVELERLKKDLIEAGISKEELDDADLERIALVFNPKRFAGFKEAQENIFAIHRGDKVSFYQVHPDLYKTLQALDTPASNWLIRLLGAVSEPLHVGAVATMGFGLRNIIKDTGTKTLYSKAGIHQLAGDFVRGFAEAIKKGELYAEWEVAGGAQSAMVSLSREALEKQVLSMFDKNEKPTTKIINAFTSPYRAVRTLLELFEEASRLGEYIRERGDGTTREDKLKAAYASREVTVDFQRGGRKGKQWNLVVRFFNPSIQGADKFAREFRKDPGRMLVRGSLIALISLLTYAINRDNPEYQEEPRYRKDKFWCFYPTDGTTIYIPKPFEPGIVFGSSVERLLEYIDTNDPDAMAELVKSIWDELSPDIIPTAMAGLIEQISNRSLLTGAPIVPEREKRLEPRDQYGPTTTAPARELGQLFSVSPRRIEALISAYTGGMGLEILGFLDLISGEATSKKSIPQLIPGVKGLVGRPYTGSRSIDQLYEELERLNKQKASYDKARKSGKRPPLPNLYRHNQLQTAADYISRLRKEQDRILESSRYTPEQKRRMVDNLKKQMVNRARSVMGKQKAQ